MGRVRRLKIWILGFTLGPGAILLLAGLARASAGYILGGALVFMNLLGTEHTFLFLTRGERKARILGLLLYFGKLALTAVLLAGALLTRMVPPLALVAGVTTLLLGLTFDFLFFPRDIGGD